MKKVKIMLIAITVLAATGGALAFKANKGDLKFCTSEYNNGCLPEANCQGGVEDVKAEGAIICGFETLNTAECPAKKCPAETFTAVD